MNSTDTNNFKILLPPDRGSLALNLVIFGLSFLMVVTNMELSSFRHDTRVLLAASILLFVVTTRGFLIDRHYLTVTLFGLRIRKIPLSDIQQVIYFSQWNNGSRVVKDGIFFITLRGCDRFVSEYDQVGSFSRRHPIRSMFAYVPKGKEQAYLEQLRTLLGDDVVLD